MMGRVQISLSLEQVVELSAKLMVTQEMAGEMLTTLERITGLPLRDAARRMKENPDDLPPTA